METKLVAYRNNTSTPAVLEQYNLDLQKSPDVKVNYKWLDLQDPSSRKSSFTQTIKLPFTNTNNKFFENFFDVNLDTLVFNSRTKFSAVLSVDTVPQLDGFIQLKSIYLNAQLYEIALFGNVADFFTDLKDKKLRDTLIQEDGTVDEQFDHLNTAENVCNSWGTSYSSGGLTTVGGDVTNHILYPIIDYGNQTGYFNTFAFISPSIIEAFQTGSEYTWSEFLDIVGMVKVQNLKPAIRIQRLFQLIAQRAGYTIKSTFLGIDGDTLTDTNWFSRMFMTLAPQFAKVRTEAFAGFEYTCGSHGIGNTGYYTERITWNSVEFDSNNLWSVGTNNTIDFDYDNTPTPYVSDDMGVQVNLNVTFPSTFTNGDAISSHSFRLRWIALSPEYFGATVEQESFNGITNGTTQDISFFTELPINNFGGLYQLQIDYTAYPVTSGPNQVVDCTVNSGTILTLNNGTTLFSNGTANSKVIIAENMPDITQGDFVKDIINRFNLITVIDENNEKKLIIEPYNDYIQSGSTLYWTDKLDTSKEQVVKTTNEIQSKKLVYSDQEDDDYFNDSYKSQWDVVYGSKIKFNRNDFANKEFENFSIFSPFIAQGFNDQQGVPISNVAIANIWQVESLEGTIEESEKKPMESGKPKLFYYSGTPVDISGTDYYNNSLSFHLYTGAYSTLGATEAFNTNNKFPLCTPYDLDNLNTGITANTRTLHWQYYNPYFNSGFNINVFGDTPTIHGLYNDYWAQYINEIYSEESRIVECHINLDQNDIYNFSFANTVFIKNTLFRVLEINNYLVGGNKSTKVKLIKVIDRLVYDCDVIPSTFNTDGTITFVDPEDGTTVSTVTNKCCEFLDDTWTFNQTNSTTGVGLCYHNQNVGVDGFQSISATIDIGNVGGDFNNPNMLPMFIQNSTNNTILRRSSGNTQFTEFYMYTNTVGTAESIFKIKGNTNLLVFPDDTMVVLEIQLYGTVMKDDTTPANAGKCTYQNWHTIIKTQKGTVDKVGAIGGVNEKSITDTGFPTSTPNFTNIGNDQQYQPKIQAVAGTQKIKWVAKFKMFLQPIPEDNNQHPFYAIFQNESNMLFQDLNQLLWN